MNHSALRQAAIPVLGLFFMTLQVGCSGSDGSSGPPGPPGGTTVDVSATPHSVLAELDIVSKVTGVTIASPPRKTISRRIAGSGLRTVVRA